MSEFDKSLAEKLQEEAEFPNRKKNWDALAQRLNAFETGSAPQGASYLRYWQLAAVGLALLSALSFWKIQHLQQVNTALEQAQANWQKEQTNNASDAQAVQAKPGNSDSQRLGSPNPNPFWSEITNPQDAPPTNNFSKSGHSATVPIISEAYRQTNRGPSVFRNKNVATEPEAFAPTAGVPVVTPEPKPTLADQTLPSENPPPASAPEASNVAASWGQLDALAPSDQLPLVAPERLPNLPSAPYSPKIIQPYREKAGRFRLGIQAIAATTQPRETGVSWMKGAGVNAEFSPLKNIWLTAELDWVSYQVKTMDYLPKRFFSEKPPKPPKSQGGGGHHSELVLLEGQQGQRAFSLGLRYVLPVEFWLRPSVQFAHSWTHLAPSIYSFSFEEFDPGHPPNHHEPDRIAHSTSGHSLQNTWRFGAGLEHETHNWVFRAGVEWSEGSGASQASYDALVLRTGLSYKF